MPPEWKWKEGSVINLQLKSFLISTISFHLLYKHTQCHNIWGYTRTMSWGYRSLCWYSSSTSLVTISPMNGLGMRLSWFSRRQLLSYGSLLYMVITVICGYSVIVPTCTSYLPILSLISRPLSEEQQKAGVTLIMWHGHEVDMGGGAQLQIYQARSQNFLEQWLYGCLICM